MAQYDGVSLCIEGVDLNMIRSHIRTYCVLSPSA